MCINVGLFSAANGLSTEARSLILAHPRLRAEDILFILVLVLVLGVARKLSWIGRESSRAPLVAPFSSADRSYPSLTSARTFTALAEHPLGEASLPASV